MVDRDWDKELAKVDKQLASLSDEALLKPTAPSGSPKAAPQPVGKSAPAEPRRPACSMMPGTSPAGAVITTSSGTKDSLSMLVTAGILLGSVLGLWFWYRLLPVPSALDDPFSPGRWTLIGIHIAMIVLGLMLASAPLVTG